MRCPFCGYEDTKVLDSRPREDGVVIRRRRVCPSCGKRFTTLETMEVLRIYVVKSDGRREMFNRDKLIRGIQLACTKRPVSVDDVESIASRVETDLRLRGDREVSSREIGELVMRYLRELDEVAYVRFASVYRKFQTKEEFLEELKQLETSRSESAAENVEGEKLESETGASAE
ncbi:MAG TPA: transcriptional repressor NrdR [Bacteroidetes bacterium]|nr:transcriptional repressor NrdR [Bacteroidota bacterium]